MHFEGMVLLGYAGVRLLVQSQKQSQIIIPFPVQQEEDSLVVPFGREKVGQVGHVLRLALGAQPDVRLARRGNKQSPCGTRVSATKQSIGQ